jgi:hypothetical protein
MREHRVTIASDLRSLESGCQREECPLRRAQAPLNARMVEIVHAVEARGAGSPKLSAKGLWSALTETSSSRGRA